MVDYAPQVGMSHYQGSYRDKDRWLSYWYQQVMVGHVAPGSVLEIGPGEGVVTDVLRRAGVSVTTYDIDPDLKPDVVGSVTSLPFAGNSFDAILAAEVLEHIEFNDVPQALREIGRVARTHAIISLPHPGYVFSIIFKLPLLPRIEMFAQMPFFWKKHVFNGEHYWELGKKGYSVSRFVRAAREAGLTLLSYERHADDPAHRFFLFSK